MARIELRGIRKSWGAAEGVKGVDLDVADEEFVVLLGPSGCGKTTTMRMIAGLEEPTEGEVVMNGEIVNGIDSRDRDVAMVFQGYALYPNMSIYENIRFPLRMRGVPGEEHEARVRQAAGMVELTEYLDRKPSALSGGQRQRAALARAIVRQPQAFLMDEPLSNLDAKLRQHMRVRIKRIQRELGITTVYVTHDQIEAMTLADRIVVMQSGEVQQIGAPDEIYNDPANAFVAGFIGAPPMNLVEGAVENGEFSAGGMTAPVPLDGSKSKVLLGFRPEDCVVPGDRADLVGSVYGIEPTGDATYVTLKADKKLIEVKAGRDFRAEFGNSLQVTLDSARLYLFDAETGLRLRRDGNPTGGRG